MAENNRVAEISAPFIEINIYRGVHAAQNYDEIMIKAMCSRYDALAICITIEKGNSITMQVNVI